jgi:hypothetical protein
MMRGSFADVALLRGACEPGGTTDPDVLPEHARGKLCSWAWQCPSNDQSAGKRRSERTRKGSKHLNAALKDAAMAAMRTNDSYL